MSAGGHRAGPADDHRPGEWAAFWVAVGATLVCCLALAGSSFAVGTIAGVLAAAATVHCVRCGS